MQSEMLECGVHQAEARAHAAETAAAQAVARAAAGPGRTAQPWVDVRLLEKP